MNEHDIIQSLIQDSKVEDIEIKYYKQKIFKLKITFETYITIEEDHYLHEVGDDAIVDGYIFYSYDSDHLMDDRIYQLCSLEATENNIQRLAKLFKNHLQFLANLTEN